MHPPRGNSQWELYNVDKDPGDLDDKAGDEPEKLKELIVCWEQYYAETGMFEYPFEFVVAKA